MISQNILPEGLVARCLDVLRKLSMNERDLIRVVVEVVHELRDPAEEEQEKADASTSVDADESMTEFGSPRKQLPRPAKPPTEMTPEEKQRMDAIDLRCLSLCIGMLEHVNGVRVVRLLWMVDSGC